MVGSIVVNGHRVVGVLCAYRRLVFTQPILKASLCPSYVEVATGTSQFIHYKTAGAVCEVFDFVCFVGVDIFECVCFGYVAAVTTMATGVIAHGFA